MRITLFLLTVLIFEVSAVEADAQNAKITLSVSNGSIKEVLKEIEKQSDITFFYNDLSIDMERKVQVNVKNKGVKDVLAGILPNCSFEIDGKRIIIIPDSQSIAQDGKKITGTVIDSNGEPVIGANISEKGTRNGTASDVEGKFDLQINPGAILVISYIGYTTQEVVVGNQTSLNITLSESNLALDEVVVVGYGTQRKATLTGAITSVAGSVTANKSNTSLLNALQGTLSGVGFSRTAGTPGNEGWDFQIRGASSLNGSTPLLIIDDIPFTDHTKINNLTANDIESISVLKDASAAIYGARAGGGVILVTTKKGDEPKPTIHYSGQLSVKYPGIYVQSTNRQQYGLMIDEGNKNDHKTAGDATVGFLRDWDYWMNGYDGAVRPGPLSDAKDFTYADNDWADLIFGSAIDHGHDLNLSGKGKKYRYFSSIAYHTDNGVLNYGNTKYNRLNLRVGGIYDVTDKLKVEVSLAMERVNRHLPAGLNNGTNFRINMPNIALENPFGQPYAYGGTRNPIVFLREGGDNQLKFIDYHAKLKLDYSPIKDLTITAMASNNGGLGNHQNLGKQIDWYDWEGNLIVSNPTYAQTQVYKQSDTNFYENYTAYFNYQKAFGVNSFSLMGGASYESSEFSSFWARRYKLISEEIPSLNMGESTEQYNGDSYEAWKIASLFGRFNYAFNNKYLFEANLRYDGSSRFAPTKRYETFGGVSVGWVLSEEEFMKEVSFINFLKVRGSYGSVGNQNGIGLYDYLQLININAGTTVLGETGTRFAYTNLGGIASSSRTWERVNNTNIGLDVNVLNNRLSAGFDYFWKRNSNMLIATTLPSILGVGAPTMNIGDLKTWGWEMTLQWRDKAGEVNYFAALNLSDNQNKLIDLDGLDNVSAAYVTAREGYPINSLFGYEAGGIMKTQEEVDEYKKMPGVQQNLRIGDMKYLDISGDGRLNPSPDKTTGDPGDLKYLGNRNPRYVFAINAGLDYKRFDFSFLLQGQMKRTGSIIGIMNPPGRRWFENQDYSFFGKTYNPETNPNAKFPALSTTDNIGDWNYRSSTNLVYNNRYGRLKNITLGYTFPKYWMSKLKVEQLRLYISGNDVWEYKGYQWNIDPETNNYGLYPLNRSWLFGLDITF